MGGCFSLIPQNYLSQRIDIALKVVYYHIQKRGVRNASLLCEMPSQEGNEGRPDNKDEERQTSNEGRMPRLWHQDVPDRQELGI
jgi:hypothetical protein